ncbi:MAG: NifB/NifX family molybdenum-iron cluster-binding protein [Victivallaceae bacterium]|nr:NifB/NifX family molybdenum-iron cluster-binding protein [Victivallaceae bacterium]
MKLVFPANGTNLTAVIEPRFGRSPYFVCYDTETAIVESIPNDQNLSAAQGAGIQAATTVAGLGADYAVCSHCGPKAFRVLQAAGIKVICGAQGRLEDVIKDFEAGRLKETAAADVEGHWL